MTAILSIVLAAILGIAGLRTATVATENTTVRVAVTYASVTRPGLSTPFRIEISSAGAMALPAELTVSVDNDYFALFDENGFDPPPDSVHFDGRSITWTFQTDGHHQLVIDLDARLQPNVHRGRSASVTVSASGMEPVVAHFRTRVFG